MKSKKSKFWLGVWSLVPGAGEMYLGFMKMGVSLMLAFGVSIALISMTGLDALSILPVTIYIYSFFHANNLGRVDDQTFQNIEDVYLFGLEGISDIRIKVTGKYRKAAAIVLIFVGVVMIWNTIFTLLCDIFGWDNAYLSQVYYFVRDEVPRILIGIAVIWGGIVMLRGKKAEEPAVETTIDENAKNVYEAYNRVTEEVEEGKENGTEENKNA